MPQAPRSRASPAIILSRYNALPVVYETRELGLKLPTRVHRNRCSYSMIERFKVESCHVHQTLNGRRAQNGSMLPCFPCFYRRRWRCDPSHPSCNAKKALHLDRRTSWISVMTLYEQSSAELLTAHLLQQHCKRSSSVLNRGRIGVSPRGRILAAIRPDVTRHARCHHDDGMHHPPLSNSMPQIPRKRVHLDLRADSGKEEDGVTTVLLQIETFTAVPPKLGLGDFLLRIFCVAAETNHVQCSFTLILVERTRLEKALEPRSRQRQFPNSCLLTCRLSSRHRTATVDS